jgi:Fe-S cluster biogenesis protein NfuA
VLAAEQSAEIVDRRALLQRDPELFLADRLAQGSEQSNTTLRPGVPIPSRCEDRFLASPMSPLNAEARRADSLEMRESLPRELHERVEASLDRIRPALIADGGNVELLDVAGDGTVRLELQGACASCPAQSATLRYGIERVLLSEVDGIRGVVALPPRAPDRSE